jgi:choline monooxygenase
MANAQTLPWSWYTDPSILAREREQVFRPSWQYVGHSGMLPEPGSFFPAELAGTPIVVTLDREGVLRALVNVCAHRGSIVCEAPGSRNTLQCPYHAWTYRLDGTLLSAPRSDREESFDAADHELPAVQVDTWGPFIFACASPDTPALAEALGDIPDRLADLMDLKDLVFRQRWTGRYRANWKVCVENFLECYHCRVAHPSFNKVVDTGPDDYRLISSPPGSSQYGPVRQSWSGALDPVGPIGRGQFHLIHPNTAINVFPGQPNLSIGPVIPTEPGATHRVLDYFFGAGVDEEWIESLLKLDEQVGREDLHLVESVQRGMESGARARGSLFVDSEELIAHFGGYIRSALEA